jgi:hypothetical protein
MGAMSKRILSYLLLACLVGGVFLSIGFQATRSPSLRVGTTIRDPQGYFTQRLRHHLPCRVSVLTSQPGGIYVYDTRFVLLSRQITSSVSVYRFDTNGTVLSVYSRRYWPLFRF